MNILVVGATGGIGSKIVPRFALAGVKQTLLGRNADKLIELKESLIGTQTQFVQGDATDEKVVRKAFDKAAEYGRIDAVVISAGSHKANDTDTPVEESAPAFRRHLEEFGQITFNVALVAAQIFKEQNHGMIISISSHVTSKDRHELPRNLTYRIGKKLSENVLEEIGAELSGTKVQIGTINPSTVNTPGNEKYFKSEDDRAKAVQPEDIADVILEYLRGRPVEKTLVMNGRFKF